MGLMQNITKKRFPVTKRNEDEYLFHYRRIVFRSIHVVAGYKIFVPITYRFPD
jgi:hypothetical protein